NRIPNEKRQTYAVHEAGVNSRTFRKAWRRSKEGKQTDGTKTDWKNAGATKRAIAPAPAHELRQRRQRGVHAQPLIVVEMRLLRRCRRRRVEETLIGG